MEQKVKAALDAIDAVSTTADVRTGYNRSYLGITAHWINPVTLMRCKAALCCTRVVGRDTYDVLAAKIEHVHSSYGLTRKVTGVTFLTDHIISISDYVMIRSRVCHVALYCFATHVDLSY